MSTEVIVQPIVVRVEAQAPVAIRPTPTTLQVITEAPVAIQPKPTIVRVEARSGGGGAAGDHNVIPRTITDDITIATDTTRLFRYPKITTGSITIEGSGEMLVL